MMLAFDTATEIVAIGVGRRDPQTGAAEVMAECNLRAPRAALGRLLPAVRSLLDEVSVDVLAVEEIVVGRGPGSFTGVRIGVATAKGLAHGLGVPLHGVGTLDAVARRAPAFDGLVAVVGDAMRGEVYPALFRCEDGRCERLGGYSVASPEAVAAEWAREQAEPLLLTGNGLSKHAAVFLGALGGRATLAPAELWWPTGSSLLAAAGSGGVEGSEPGDPGKLLPVYTRLSDAEEAEQRRAASSASMPAGGVAGPTGGEST